MCSYIRYQLVTSAILFGSIVVATPQYGIAQEQGHIGHQHTSTGLENVTTFVLVDGEKNPSGIPDEVAFLHFFRVVGRNLAARSLEADTASRSSYIAYFFKPNCGDLGLEDRSLTQLQRTSLMSYADSIVDKIRALETTAPQPPSPTGLQSVVIEAIQNMEAALGREVTDKVRTHVIGHMKKRIKIIQSRIAMPDQE